MTHQSKTMLLAATLGLLLSACGTAERSPIVTVSQSLTSSLSAKPQSGMTMEQLRDVVTPEKLAALGGVLLLVDLPARNMAAGMFPIAQNADVSTWSTQDRQVSVSVRDGLLVATRGFGFDLLSAQTAPSAKALLSLKQAKRQFQHLDGENQVVSTQYSCRYERSKNVIREFCETPKHSFQNTYEFDANGNIARSRQWVSPQIGYIVVELLA